MRLLNVHSLEFGEFFESDIPLYCILSHRWGANEISHKQYRKGSDLGGPSYQKIIDFCSFVRERKAFAVSWVWLDTICIDKRSSAELSEAINSMYKWYENAVECHVYLADVEAFGPITWELQASSWFRRGWTLQELLAPALCVFVDKKWRVIGHVCDDYTHANKHCCQPSEYDKFGSSLSTMVSQITTIPPKFLKIQGGRSKDRLSEASIAQRMSWASRRITTRIEDEAYSLLGIFGINMPLIYGEGRMAFTRLQEEIIKRSTDQSIFAWSIPYAKLLSPISVLAYSTQVFADAGNTVSIRSMEVPSYGITNKGLQIHARAIFGSLKELNLLNDRSFHSQFEEDIILLPLNCYKKDLVGTIADAGTQSAEGSILPAAGRIQPSVIALRKMYNGNYYRVVFDEALERQLHASKHKHVRIKEQRFSIEAYPPEKDR